MMGYKPLTYDFGIEIMDFEYGIRDKVIWRYSNQKTKWRTSLLYTTRNGRLYFKRYGKREYLDEFTR